MTKNFRNLLLTKFISGVTIIAFLSAIVVPNLALAAGITAGKDTSTRLKIGTAADHTVTWTMPTGVDFDVTTQTDGMRVKYGTTFVNSGTWLASEFTLTDSVGARTSVTPSQGSGIVDCTVAAGANNFCVAIDTTNNIFTIKPSSSWTASATGSAVTFTIAGSAGNGVLTNPASVAATNLNIQMCDEVANCFTAWTASYDDQLAYGIADDDQVTVSASVPATITFDIDANPAFTNAASAAPYLVHLGVLSSGSVKHSDGSSVEMIVINGATNGTGALVVTVQNLNGASGLVSAAVPGDTIPSATATMAAGTPNYGICVDTATLTSFVRQGIYSALTCALASGTNQVGTMTTSPVSILSVAGPISGAKAQIVVNAAISGSTKAHTDYGDTITFIGTATY